MKLIEVILSILLVIILALLLLTILEWIAFGWH
jgi:hypothetical protein